MKIHTIKVGDLATNCYILEDANSKEALVIDPGDEPSAIIDLLNHHQLKTKFIITTHGHFDHVGANRILKEKLNIPILMHEADLFGLSIVDAPAPDRFLKDGDQINLGKESFIVIHTPGHTPGGICLYNEKEKTLFSGDTLFFGTYGRVDLPYSNEKEMAGSLKRLLKLPPETIVYPGHGKPTTIGNEQNLLFDF